MRTEEVFCNSPVVAAWIPALETEESHPRGLASLDCHRGACDAQRAGRPPGREQPPSQTLSYRRQRDIFGQYGLGVRLRDLTASCRTTLVLA